MSDSTYQEPLWIRVVSTVLAVCCFVFAILLILGVEL